MPPLKSHSGAVTFCETEARFEFSALTSPCTRYGTEAAS